MRAAVAAVLAVVCCLTGGQALAQEPLRYVALGDSSAAGPLIPDQIDATCLRSDRNWPHVLAATLHAALTDVTCSGATTADLAGRQAGVVAPQFDALRPDTGLVTLAIGANDLALSSAFVTCASPGGVVVEPSCREQYTVDGRDQFEARIRATAPKVGAALAEIHRRSPRAKVVVTGYLTYWRPGGCYPADPFAPRDADYIQRTLDRLAAMLAWESATHRASYVDIRRPSARLGLCEAPAQRWLEGAVPASPAYPYHPNAAGMAHVAGILAAAVQENDTE
ncbi:lysophospholipase L1-like esterase [Amycolatopsis bartoniae]|uniref:Hydrolase n=1 Tax=Amycolatopsis bartoniae TaxID=941986 RepID=A0A8H9J3W0_9PSEU|nr:SGNH/GDSL hydrolase family protein [Amycolatopsis bartoniae]MBB2938449.1 lysophospholipase L1-like esterase [Amycolatopsis bartoniae]TVT10396.1 SGNH/GDSL hydrolase family protein [Amycolatopsis bartoniae]GHF70909.1 hydrolase [Amycolatopsis bartoniae]